LSEDRTAQTKFGVSLSRQLSRDSRIEGKSWGFTNNGCRAEFYVNH